MDASVEAALSQAALDAEEWSAFQLMCERYHVETGDRVQQLSLPLLYEKLSERLQQIDNPLPPPSPRSHRSARKESEKDKNRKRSSSSSSSGKSRKKDKDSKRKHASSSSPSSPSASSSSLAKEPTVHSPLVRKKPKPASPS